MPTREKYREMQLENSVMAPRDFRQIRNVKQKVKDKEEKRYRSNVADEILAVISMLNSHPFVQEIVHSKSKPPAIILYTEDQMKDLQFFVNTDNDHVLGVDRTFNLGSCYVTTIVYKNLKVLRNESGDHPIFLGPVFLHWDCSYESYCSFFAHISCRVSMGKFRAEVLLRPETKVGSDDEKALTNALVQCFPNTTRFLCTKHLKDNVSHYLQNKVGVERTERYKIVDELFGNNGLVSCDDTYDFERKSDKLSQDLEKCPKFAKYFSERLKPRLLENNNRPRRQHELETDKLWTNINCESMNNILKLDIQWHPKKVPELVEKLYGCVKIHQIDLRACLHGTGNFHLHPRYWRYLHATWISLRSSLLTEENQEKDQRISRLPLLTLLFPRLPESPRSRVRRKGLKLRGRNRDSTEVFLRCFPATCFTLLLKKNDTRHSLRKECFEFRVLNE